MSTTPREVGTLIAVILKARNLPNKRHIGKQDPYCTLTLNGEKRRTKAIKRGGQHPEWDEEIRFTLFEDNTLEQMIPSYDGTPPPPPPKKEERGPLRIKGGKTLNLACYAEDLREPDLIGETKVDLTEVLTKGETDEWFTLMNKDKYSGEVYLELTFWSNEPAPVKKVTPKPKAKQQYGGPGSFVPSGDSPTAAPNRSNGHHPTTPSRISSFGNSPEKAQDGIPLSLRASNSFAKVDLYVPPYETSRSHQQVPSLDSLTTDFSELGFRSSNRRTSVSPSQNYMPRPSSSIGFAETHPSSYSSHEYEQGTHPDTGSYTYDRPITPNAPYHDPATPIDVQPYQPPYESGLAPYTPPRRPRYSVPSSSSGFMPIPTPSPSRFQGVPGFAAMSSQLTGTSFMSPSSSALPFNFIPPTHNPPATGPASIGYGPPPSRIAPPTSSFPQTSFPSPMAPSSSFQSRHTHSSQSSVSFPLYGTPSFSAQQNLVHSSSQPQLPPPPAPPSTHPTGQQRQQPLVPPPPPLPALQHSYAPGEHLNATYANSSTIHPHVPPPPPLQDNSSPMQAQQPGSRPLPLPTPNQPVNPRSRRQSSLPVPPPNPTGGGYSPTGLPNHSYPPAIPSQVHSTAPTLPPIAGHGGQPSPSALPTQSHNPLPPPPPLPASQAIPPYPPISQQAPAPPPPLQPFNSQRLPSSSFPATMQNTHQQAVVSTSPTALGPPQPQSQAASRRVSLPPPPAQTYQQQSAYQSLPPPPPPPIMPAHSQHELVAFSSMPGGQVSYPGPLPRPPSQYLHLTQSHGHSSAGGGW